MLGDGPSVGHDTNARRVRNSTVAEPESPRDRQGVERGDDEAVGGKGEEGGVAGTGCDVRGGSCLSPNDMEAWASHRGGQRHPVPPFAADHEHRPTGEPLVVDAFDARPAGPCAQERLVVRRRLELLARDGLSEKLQSRRCGGCAALVEVSNLTDDITRVRGRSSASQCRAPERA